MTSDSPFHLRARWHEARARIYRQQGELLLSRDQDQYSAAALLYEAGKQCINAVANLRGSNPGTTTAKLNALREASAGESSGMTLMRNWRAVTQLHIHADRGNLNPAEFAEAWEQAEAFIDTMLDIYQRDA